MHLYTLGAVLSGGEKDRFRDHIRKSGVQNPDFVAHYALNRPRRFDAKHYRRIVARIPPVSLFRGFHQPRKIPPFAHN